MVLKRAVESNETCRGSCHYLLTFHSISAVESVVSCRRFVSADGSLALTVFQPTFHHAITHLSPRYNFTLSQEQYRGVVSYLIH